MRDEGLIDQMVQRLGRELKSVLAKVREGRMPGRAIEQVIRQGLWPLWGLRCWAFYTRPWTGG
jgi:hypothetical protein